ncbi:ankyrin repeat domain-containing protein [Capnocytophaga genosp. AHN8471]|uniref:ankyrin repeat domain-containing protein n=1 Tax=Capnocytophaga genosp. AHN8471 TaxID=327574 RepID=UPI0019342CD0|nr:ankyrin repeat domain-containing protein [Capnocytophaga genosp. AHN8471]MBM0655379.1 ankyrin repeat domain-containing protein [Capnocytophaga genosp. AHN8471]
MKTTFLILYSFLLLSTCQQQQVLYDNSVATTTVTETVEEDTSNIDDFCFNEDGFQYTQLGLACKKGDLEAVKTLLAKGADRDFAKQKGERKFDSFLVSLESGNLPLVKYIFEDVYKEHLGLDGDYQLPGSSYILRSSPLIIACKSNSLPVVSYLLQKGASPESVPLPYPQDYFRESPLLIAYEKNNYEMAKLLIKANADLSDRDRTDRYSLADVFVKRGGKWRDLVFGDNSIDKIVYSKKKDLNGDGIDDSILIYQPKNNLNGGAYFVTRIRLSEKGSFKEFINDVLLYSAYEESNDGSRTDAKGFMGITFENNTFTIKENYSSIPVLFRYTTFAIDPETNNILAIKRIYVDKNGEEQKVDNLNNTPFEEYNKD